jgi:hypothetical protein
MQEEPSFGQYYIGANANFAVVDRGEHAGPAPVTAGGRDPLDVWNPPVADVRPGGEEASASLDFGAEGK